MNKHGVSIQSAMQYWKIGEAALCEETEDIQEELAQYPYDTRIAEIWDKLTDEAKEAITNAWETDYE